MSDTPIIDHTIPDAVRADVDYALEQGIATPDPTTGDIIQPGNFTPTWRVVTFISRAYRKLSDRIDALPAGERGPRGSQGKKGDPGRPPTPAEIREAVRAEKDFIVAITKAAIAEDLQS